MMKKRFFDVGLYLDGLRQLRIIGVMMFVILELEAILMPLGQYINILQRQGNGDLFLRRHRRRQFFRYASAAAVVLHRFCAGDGAVSLFLSQQAQQQRFLSCPAQHPRFLVLQFFCGGDYLGDGLPA